MAAAAACRSCFWISGAVCAWHLVSLDEQEARRSHPARILQSRSTAWARSKNNTQETHQEMAITYAAILYTF
jgi:hypothetical protein